MINISDLIGMSVISIFNQNDEGTITDALFDCKTCKLKALVIVNDKTMENKYLKTNNIYNIGQALIIKNNSYLNSIDSIENNSNMCNPINSHIYSLTGKNIGIISDIHIGADYTIQNLTTKNINIAKSKIISLGNKITLAYDDTQKKVSINNFKAKTIMPKPSNAVKVSILPIQQDQIKSQGEIKHTTSFKLKTPNRAISNYSFLLNRKVNKNILSSNGQIIIKQSTKITDGVIDIARSYGKLKELTSSSQI